MAARGCDECGDGRREDGEQVKDLTSKQWEAVDAVLKIRLRYDYATTMEVAQWLSITMQAARWRLVQAQKAGWLERVKGGWA